MNNSPEIDGMLRDSDVSISDGNSKTKQRVGIAALLVFGAVAIYAIFAAEQEEVRNPLDNEEEFLTTTFRPPSFTREGEEIGAPEPEAKNDNILRLPPPPPVKVEKPEPQVQSTEFNVPPPPPIPVNVPKPDPILLPTPQEPAQPVQPAAPTEPEFPEKWKSKSVLVDNGGGTEAAPEGGGAEDPLVAGTDDASRFLAQVSNIQDRSAKARRIERIDALIPEGTLIPGILETAINSDLPGQLRAIVSKDVYSFDGRRVLIPMGTRLIGEYSSGIKTGQSRIFVVWTRLLREDGVTVRLNSIGADSLGTSGLTGFVDKKFRERFGSAIMLSIISGATDVLTAIASDLAGGQANDTAATTIEIASGEFSSTTQSIAEQALEDGLRIPPTIHVDQGERIFVYVRQDLDFSALYKSPVEEEIEKIKRERGIK